MNNLDRKWEFNAWDRDIVIRTMSKEMVYNICIIAFQLPYNTVGCSYWLRGGNTCYVILPHNPDLNLLFHELLIRCRDRDTSLKPPVV